MSSAGESTSRYYSSDPNSDDDHLPEVGASGSKSDKCIVLRRQTFPPLPSSSNARGSDDLPPKVHATPDAGCDDNGPWYRPSPDAIFYVHNRVVHRLDTCALLRAPAQEVSLCFCVRKLHKSFQVYIDNDKQLHSVGGCALFAGFHRTWRMYGESLVALCPFCFPFPIPPREQC